MTDTAQPETAAETEVASDPIADASDAFKTYSTDAPERLRGPDGKFISQEIEAEGSPEAESHDEVETDEAAEEAQPEAADLPPSWPAELAEEWQTLPAPLQDKIVQREAEREAAVNAKFQEAANVRKANEATIIEAQQSRQRFVEAADHVISMVQPQRPSLSMLQPGSHDYNPDHYHLLNAQADQAERLISEVQQHRSQAIAQLTHEAEAQAFQEIAEVEAKARPALLKAVPELTDPVKQQGALTGIVQYAVENGIPQSIFTDPDQAKYVTSAQLLLTWKAMQFDKMNAAKANVTPKAQKPSAPVVRPGVTTSKSQTDAIHRKNVMARLDKEGSIQAGADAFKLLYKGK
jgi:hypothetical protein